nr:MAG TPA: hypothetical protein [Caudoviricetes sp.]
MFEKMSDGDVMVYLRNAALQMSRIAQERGLTIDAYCTEDGYLNIKAGDYEIFRRNAESQTRYEYCPTGSVGKWKRDVQPQQIRFGQEPMEEEHGQ